MVIHQKTWALALLVLVGLAAPAEPDVSARAAQREPRVAALTAARTRLQEHEQERLQCVDQREWLARTIAARKAACDAELQQFQQCRAERRDLKGAELWRCGLGLAMGVASELSGPARELSECGLADAPESRESCPVPACSLDPAEIEREVLTEQGLVTMPECSA